MQLRSPALLVLAIILSSCSEPTEPHSKRSAPAVASRTVIEDGPQDAPPGAGPEYQGNTTLTVTPDAGFTEEEMEGWAWPNNMKFTAYGQSVVNYWATDVEATVAIAIRKNGTQVGGNSGETSDSHLLPANRGITVSTNAQASAGCGHLVQTTAFGQVWNAALINNLSWLQWGRKKDTQTTTANQDNCPTGTAGSGDPGPPPSGSPGTNCRWVRDFVIYVDMTWDWLNSWHRSCDGDETRVAPRTPSGDEGSGSRLRMDAAATAAGQTKRQYRVRLFGTGDLGNGKRTVVYRDPQSSVDAIITVDTTKATGPDLEEALSTVPHVADRPAPATARNILGSLNGPPSIATMGRAGPGSRSDRFLRQLGSADENTVKTFGRGRVLDLVIDRSSLALVMK